MKVIVSMTLMLSVLILGAPEISNAEAPLYLGGFKLGAPIEDFKTKVDMSTVLPLRYVRSLKEVAVTDMPGFKSGLVYFGTCYRPNDIIRIRFKYQDSSKDFFEELLERYKKRFGRPDEWRGDPFGMVLSWKWSFTDDQGNSISLVLQHNTRDADQRIGNAVKMTMTNLMEQERACYEKRNHSAENDSAESKPTPRRQRGNIDWDRYLPH